MEQELKIMKRIVDTIQKDWEKLSPDSRRWVKARFDLLNVDGPVRNDAEKERT